jgi:hypothetical protein
LRQTRHLTIPPVHFPAFIHAWSISTGFIAGVNPLDFIVYDDAGPTAVRVEMLGTADAAAVISVPEPATLALFGASPPSQGEGLDRIILRQFWVGRGGLGPPFAVTPRVTLRFSLSFNFFD